MNILYEGLREKGALMLIPNTAVKSMGLGGMLGAAVLGQQTLSRTVDAKSVDNGRWSDSRYRLTSALEPLASWATLRNAVASA